MRIVRPLVLITLSALSFSACQKDDIPFEEQNKPVHRVKTYTETIHSSFLGDISETYNLSYDDNNRIASMISADDPGNKFVFTYPNSTLFQLDIYTDNAVVIHEDGFLNESKMLDSTFQYNDEGDTTTEKHFYNADKLVVKTNEYNYTTAGGSVLMDQTNYTYDSNKRLIEESNSLGVTKYEYDGNVANTIDLYPVFFMQVKQLPSKTIYSSGGDETVTAIHTYTFDSMNRITSDKSVLSTGDEIIKSYTYY
ncbi:MAG: hypothetical protein JNK79_06450 [Chitinophagaceae bacterium]|nr:hypothetical protein [Chitinophagaceae bacterium]